MLTPDFDNLIIVSDASITDLISFHGELRDIEASVEGILFPQVHTYKEVPLGGGAIFPALAFVNGWTLQFPVGNYVISGGNLAVNINPVNNCYVYQTQSSAYAVTASGGGSGTITDADIHSGLDSYLNKDGYKADVSSVPTATENADAVFTKIVQ